MFKDFFKENGKYSMTRLNTFLLVVASVLLAFLGGYLVFTGKTITELNYLIIALLGFAIGGKVTQKFAEMKINANEELNPPGNGNVSNQL